MNSSGKKLLQRVVAVVVIVALLDMVGVPTVVMMFFTGVVLVVFFVSRRSQNRELERIFEFYVAADAILRDEERRWYGFEIADVIEDGERALEAIPDSPPLHYFALAALYYQVGHYEVTEKYLARLLEDESYDERHMSSPSPQLRRYVAMLREIEYNPVIAPQTLAAVRALERARRRKARELLDESRRYLEATSERVRHQIPLDSPSSSGQLDCITPPLPITELLNDIYRDDQVSH
jgi:tetratricopeptide (TPR) repeat protein